MRRRSKFQDQLVCRARIFSLLVLICVFILFREPAQGAKKPEPVGEDHSAPCVFKFPESKSYGNILLLSRSEKLNDSGVTGIKATEARGSKLVTAPYGIIFKANAYLALQPELLASLPPACVKELVLRDLDISDHAFSYARNLKKIGNLDLRGTDVTDAAFAVISTFKDLEYLDLSSTGIDGSGCSQLAGLPKLRSLRIAANAIKHFKGLEALHQLVYLDLNQSGIVDADLPSIGKLSNLSNLEARKSAITDAGVASLKGLKHLYSLDLRETKVTPKAIAQLAGVPLKKLSLSGITKADQKALSAIFPGLICADHDENRDSADTIFAPLH